MCFKNKEFMGPAKDKKLKRGGGYVDVHKVMHMYLKGERMSDIADACKCAQSYVSLLKKRHGWPERPFYEGRPQAVLEEEKHLVRICARKQPPVKRVKSHQLDSEGLAAVLPVTTRMSEDTPLLAELRTVRQRNARSCAALEDFGK